MKCIRRLAGVAVFLLPSCLFANTYTVTSTADSGAGTLRQAMLDANAHGGLDTIAFNVSGAGCDGTGICTIVPLTSLPGLTDAVTIDGYTQPGTSPNTNAVGAINAVLKIVVSGAGSFAPAFAVSTDNFTIRGLVINDFSTGIGPNLSNDGRIQGCFIGVDASGLVAVKNSWGINGSSDLNLTIGGPAPADRNLISGNDQGVYLGGAFGSPGGLIQGNLVGTTASGDAPLGNVNGIQVSPTAGTITIKGNVISGNGPVLQGVGILTGNGGGAHSCVIQGNWIGTDATGTLPIGNRSWGILLGDQGSTVGGTLPGEGNVIAYNNTGVGYTCCTPLNHSPIRGNSIYSNEGGSGGAGLGIDLAIDGVTLNDLGDADTGSNDRQNFPIIASAIPAGGSTTVLGTLNSLADTTFTIDFYSNPVCVGRPQGFREGQTYLGATDVTTDGSGNATIHAVLPVVIAAGSPVTATATSPDGNTSEFSQRIVLSSTPGGGSAAGGTSITLTGFNFLPGAVVTIGTTPATGVVVSNYNQITAETPALGPGTLNGVTVTNTDGSAGTLPNGWIADFLDVPGGQQFHEFVTTLVRNAITVGVGGGEYGVALPTLRQQMAVFLLRAEHGLCYTPPPCAGVFPDVPCPSSFAAWIEALAAEGITGGCSGGNFCPASSVTRQQMAVFLLKTEHGSTYVPPPCVGVFADVPCASPFAPWIERLAAENITGGCGGSNYCPGAPASRGQMAVFMVKTFGLQ